MLVVETCGVVETSEAVTVTLGVTVTVLVASPSISIMDIMVVGMLRVTVTGSFVLTTVLMTVTVSSSPSPPPLSPPLPPPPPPPLLFPGSNGTTEYAGFLRASSLVARSSTPDCGRAETTVKQADSNTATEIDARIVTVLFAGIDSHADM